MSVLDAPESPSSTASAPAPRLPSEPRPSPSRRRRGVAVLAVLVAVLAAAIAAVMTAAIVRAQPISEVPGLPMTQDGGGPLQAGLAPGAGFAPTADDGVIDGSATLADLGLPAIARLDPALLAALSQAADAAEVDDIALEVTSGWRSRDYQQWLFDDAVRTHGSAEAAAEWVATPDASSHVTGQAVDIGPLDAQLWLMEHGAQWGLCQIYANERWHYELATEPGGVCPPQRENAAG